MGMNTTIVILNDGLDAIAKDKDFGAKLVEAILSRNKILHSGNGNVGKVVETHNADFYRTIRVGGNTGTVLD